MCVARDAAILGDLFTDTEKYQRLLAQRGRQAAIHQSKEMTQACAGGLSIRARSEVNGPHSPGGCPRGGPVFQIVIGLVEPAGCVQRSWYGGRQNQLLAPPVHISEEPQVFLAQADDEELPERGGSFHE